MSYAVLRGEPNDSQRYLDKILDAVLSKRNENEVLSKRTRASVSLAEVLYYCMGNNLNGVHMINGATGESFTIEQILRRSVSIARALNARGLKGKHVIVVTMNHEHMAALYYGMIFAGVVPFIIDPNATVFELKHFMELVSPNTVFCESNRYDDVLQAVRESHASVFDVVIINQENTLQKFIGDHNGDFTNFGVSVSSPDSTVLLLPTSGSTGLPKATIINNQALVTHLPSFWAYHSRFPRPTELALLSTTAQWLTNTLVMVTCPVYQITLLISPKKLTTDHLLEMAEKNRPTWMLLGPAIATAAAEPALPHHLVSLETLLITGAPPADIILHTYKEKLPKHARIINGYGMTEMQGFVAIPDDTGVLGTPLKSTGRVLNVILYKIVDEDGKELGPYEQGELWLKSDLSVFKGYLKMEEVYHDVVTPEGWLKTGDVFYRDENEQMFFVFRKKFSFKYLGNHVSPEEIENLISSIPGVQECVVCDSGRGPAAAVSLREGFVVTREQIHNLINSLLSDHKRLRGGIAYVEKLPHTPSAKLHRLECTKYMKQLIASGDCY